MLRIYDVALEMLADVAEVVDVIGRYDKDLVRQLRRASMSVVLNISEAGAVRDGRRRVRHGDALGSALETRACVEAAVAIGYLEAVPKAMRARLMHIIRVLYKLV